MQPCVRCATLNGYLGLARSLQIDGEELLRRVGLDPTDLAYPEKWISAPAVARLLEASALASGRSDFALRLAQLRRLSTIGPVSLVLREEPDLRSALTLLMRYEHSFNETVRLDLTESERLATMRLWCEFGEPAPSEQSLALAVAALHGIIRECLGQDWRALLVCFSFPGPADRELYYRMFGPGLRFEHEFTGFVFYRRDLDKANALADPLMRPYAERLLHTMTLPEASGTSYRTHELVETLLPLGRCSIEQVARTMGMDPRTLQRRLAARGDSFTGIVNSTRAGLAERHLANDVFSMTQISELLGFAAPSAFSRWFTKQFGVPPREWRRTAIARH